MKNLPIEDVLSWERFFNESKKRNFYPPKEIEMFNRLVSHTNNFFVIAAIGAFTPGYLMLVTKKLLPSFCLIDDEQLNELKWLIKVTASAIKETYNREVVYFEHGMCACVGGLDRAHLHFMTVSKDVNDDLLKKTINKVLSKRKAGIKSVEINGYKLENIHDIVEIMNSTETSSYKVNGKQLYFDDIKNNLDIKNWPVSARDHVSKGGHYVYFQTNSISSSFLTNKNFQTQLGRQIVFETEIEANNTIKEMSDKILKKNNYASIWKWQEFSFKENMLKTMEDLIPALFKIEKDNKNNKFNFQTFKKK